MEEDDAGQKPPQASTLCALECGFHGNAETRNLCSQCYDTVLLSESYMHLSTDNAPQATTSSSLSRHTDTIATNDECLPISAIPEPPLSSSNEENSVKAIPELPQRCFKCKKRLVFRGFKCRCSEVFCAQHRHHNTHDCTHDYHAEAKDKIAKDNPRVRADKMDKI